MTLLNKILLAIAIFSVVGAGVFIVYKEHQITQTQLAIQNSLIQTQTLVDGIVRSQSQYMSQADFQKFAAANDVNLKAIQSNLSDLGGKIDAINNFQVTSNQQSENNIPSTGTTPNPTPANPPPTVNCNGQQIPCLNTDPYGYQKNIQNLQISETFTKVSVPVGTVSFDASKDKPWSLNIPTRKYNVNTVVAHTATGQILTYNQMSITSGVDNQERIVDIDSSKTVETYPASSWSFFSPKLFLGVSGGANVSTVPIKGEITPSLSIGVISYGKTVTNPDLSILQVGVGYQGISQRVGLEISPIQLNIGNILNLSSAISNTYIGPTVGLNTGNQYNIGLGLRVGL